MNFGRSVLFFILISAISNLCKGALRRCFVCRSRGELGSCKDPFTLNSTLVVDEIGVEAQPCASGWCGKMIEGESAFKEEYGMATQRMCLQRGPSDGEERCAYTVWDYKKVYMCFCLGDLCNGTSRLNLFASPFIYLCSFLLVFILPRFLLC